MLKLSKTSSPQKLFDYDCVTLYTINTKLDYNVQKREVEVNRTNYGVTPIIWDDMLRNFMEVQRYAIIIEQFLRR